MDTTTNQNSIQLLPEHIIDQIKAGEVIERPATLIKEILENSIDAKATKVELHLIDNGLELIAIKDNGIGIAAKDLSLAFCRHATSKIDRFEDIYRLSSFGFRGEALASMASISRIICSSKTKTTSGQLKIEGGETLFHEELKENNNQTGTEIYIKDLFYNTPVRMKFIQSKTSEKNFINKILKSFLIMNPHVEFSIKWDHQEKEIYQIKSPEDRIQEALFKKRPVSFTCAQTDYDGVHFKVFLSEESSKGNAHKQHYLFINNRFVQDIQIHKIILNSAKGFWPEGETGHYVAQLFVPNDEIDVNVHPNKTVVKLFKAPKVYSIISGTVKSKIVTTQLKNETLPEQETVALLPTEEFEKNIDYKTIDFNQKQDVQNYMDHIHDQNQIFSTKVEQSYLHTPDFILNIKKDGIYIAEKSTTILTYINQLLTVLPEDNESIPLLVSRPIKLKNILSAQLENLLQSLGFEFDYMEKTNLILRSFPKALQHLPYLSILESLIQAKKNSLRTIDLEAFTESTIEKIFEENFETLRQQEVIQKLQDKDLRKIYVSKK